MALRLIITLNAAPGKGAEFAEAFRTRCAEVMQEPGCEQFEVFRSVLDPDKLVLHELWTDQAALDATPRSTPPARRCRPACAPRRAPSARTTSTAGRVSAGALQWR